MPKDLAQLARGIAVALLPGIIGLWALAKGRGWIGAKQSHDVFSHEEHRKRNKFKNAGFVLIVASMGLLLLEILKETLRLRFKNG